MELNWPSLPPIRPEQPKVAVLLCTYNGAQFLKAQLESIAAQTHQNTEIWASDDGSSDQTREILLSAQRAWGSERLKVIDGPRRGFAQNFLFLACHPSIEADYFAFSDQDDLWLPNKLSRAIDQLQIHAENLPCLYGAATRLIDTQGHVLGPSSLTPNILCFENALVQNVASGNTLLFNQTLRQILQLAGNHLQVVSHDWWVYIVATAVGGHVTFDREPQVDYRQHKGNLIGANKHIVSKLKRIKAMSTGRLLDWLWINCACLKNLEQQLPTQNLNLLRALTETRQQSRLQRLRRLPKLTIRRQSTIETWILKAAILASRAAR